MGKILAFLQTAGKGKVTYSLIGLGLLYLVGSHVMPGVLPPIDQGTSDAIQKAFELALMAAVRRAIG